MPAIYTHDRFGSALLETLPAEIRKIVTRFPRLYRAGLQGPDFFFYYSPGIQTSIGALGSVFHHQSGTEFFTRAAQAADTEAGRAYLWGLLAHYALDSVCHPYVREQVESGSMNHLQLESEFERYLMALDGVASPETHHRGKQLKLTRGECVTVAAFFPPAEPGHVNRAVKFMVWCQKVFAFPQGMKRRLVVRVLKSLGGSRPYLLVPSRAEPKFKAVDQQMLALYTQALERYPLLLTQLQEHMTHGAPLGTEFEPVFE